MTSFLFSHTPPQIFSYCMEKVYRSASINFPFTVPPSIILEPTNACNLSCIGCLKNTELKEEFGFMDINKASNLLKDVGSYLSSILLNGFGEPLLHPQFSDFLRLIHEGLPKTKICFFTNGLLLTEALAESIVHHEVYEIIISLDSSTSETYKKIRGGDFSAVIQNIRKLLDIKKKNRKKFPLVKSGFTIAEENRSEFADFIKLIHSIGIEPGLVDIVNTKWGYTGKYSDTDVLKEARDICHSIFPNVDLDIVFPALRHNSKPICPLPFVPYIAWNGDLKACCYMPLASEYPLGNVFQSPFRKVWHSEQNRYLRSELLQNRFLPFCHNCTKLRENGNNPDY